MLAALRPTNPLPWLITLFCLIWSSVFAVARLGLAHCPPLTLLSIRFALAAVVTLGLALALGERLPRGRALLALALIGIANHAIYLGLSYLGMRHVPAGLTAIIVSANPVLTAFLAAMALSERLNGRKLAGLALGVVGVVFILRHRIVAGTDSAVDMLWPLGALVALSAGAILFKRIGLNSGGGFGGLTVQLSAAALFLAFPAWALEGGLGAVQAVPEFWFSLAYQVILASVIAYAIWFHLLRVSTATAASAWHFLIPPLGVLFGWLIMDETVMWADFAGIVPVAAGIWLVTRAPERR
ncbi:DMT family transporter [Magnetospirillum sulfuroxidans]|uniref:DMT family transporter n=1 Tax=Magnetospirillum sulfuroxidans TaxID=611300 RepID=A0ABS5I7N5_9PROT|nr:DMT family transporter [Magnetospirillum sulfuroxidans]MBR9970261.1 DMT family transporter [Magnetospirillum sulfuroxidans]